MRSGTTWLTNLLLEHPKVRLGSNERKELHFLTRALGHGWTNELRDRYFRLFDGRGCPGEFTPAYLRCIWTAPIAATVIRPTTPVIVLLRDPILRFESEMRFAQKKGNIPPIEQSQRLAHWSRTAGSSAQWSGMYASQLEAWAAHIPPQQLHVIQYERAVEEPQATADRLWEAMGLDSVPLERVDERSGTSAAGYGWDWSLVPDLQAALETLYAPEVERLERRWGIDRELWPHFRQA